MVIQFTKFNVCIALIDWLKNNFKFPSWVQSQLTYITGNLPSTDFVLNLQKG